MADTLHKPVKGKLTFDSEGNNEPNSKYFSRKAHVPTLTSGVTIGRGYDMKHRSKDAIYNDLIKAGISSEDSTKLSNGANLTGQNAKDFINKDEIKKINISEESQKKLFDIVYPVYFNDARRICEKARVQRKYGKCNWTAMETKVKELIADLIYRGDYTPKTRTFLQEALVSGDIKKINEALDKIKNVPIDRQKRRKDHIK